MRKWVVPITIVCIISGFFLSYQLNNLSGSTNSNPLSEKNQNLVQIITDLEDEINKQETIIVSIRAELETLEDQPMIGALEDLRNDLRDIRIVAGLTPVAGKGIRITVDDNKDGLQQNPKDDPNNYIVHYEHLLNLLSELRLAKAEAVAINGQRIITTSEIRCVGNVILINTTRIAPPFVISAIGSPQHMSEIVSSGEIDILRSLNYPVSIEILDDLTLPSYKSSLQFNYAQPIKEDDI